MRDEPDNLVLRCLRRIDERMERVETRLSELVGRTGLLEQGYAGVSRRLDQIDVRIERVERRLDLIDGHIS
jgi:tetrahydromethanopterin S-methyltransferase subunit G